MNLACYCPPMPVMRKGIGRFLTANEPCRFTLDDGSVYIATIPPTWVLGEFPKQMVDACQGTGPGIVWNLPQEPVSWGVAQAIWTTGTIAGKGSFKLLLPDAKSTWKGVGEFEVEAVNAQGTITPAFRGRITRR